MWGLRIEPNITPWWYFFYFQIYTSASSITSAPLWDCKKKFYVLWHGTEHTGKIGSKHGLGTYGATSCSGVCCKMRAQELENQAKLDKWFIHFSRWICIVSVSRRRQISSKPLATRMHCLQKCCSADLGILYVNDNDNTTSPIFPHALIWVSMIHCFSNHSCQH